MPHGLERHHLEVSLNQKVYLPVLFRRVQPPIILPQSRVQPEVRGLVLMERRARTGIVPTSFGNS